MFRIAQLLAVAFALLIGCIAQPSFADIAFSSPHYFGTGHLPYYVDVADLDCDGNQDVVTSNLGGSGTGISILYGNGDGTLISADANTPTVTTGWLTYGVKIGDLNGDHKPDIVASSWTGDSLAIIMNDGNRHFSVVGYRLHTFAYNGGVRIADFNGDNKPDIFVNTYFWGNSGGESGRVIVFLQQPDGSFGLPYGPGPYEAYHYGISSDAGNKVEFEAIGDFNRDGNMDVVVANDRVNGYSVSILLGDGAGHLIIAHQYGSYDEVGGLAVGDFNGDCNPDFILVSHNPGGVSVNFGNGDGTFSPGPNFSVGGSPTLPWVADMNCDGNLDLLIPRTDDNTVSRIYFGDGAGGFPNVQLVPIDGWPVSIAAADMNGDHKLDIITGNAYTAGGLTAYISTVGVVLQGGTVADTAPPELTYGPYDLDWHANDISIAVTAVDTGSGLLNPTDAAFVLTTNVPAGTETDQGSTDSREVYDNAGNHVTAGPITGLKVDRKAPTVTISNTTGAVYLLNAVVNASYSGSDLGSGIASVAGNVPNGTPIDTATAGTKTFTVTATDNVANSSTQSVSYTVAFGQSVLFDQSKTHKSGSTVPIRLQLTDANGANVSSASITIHTTTIYQVSTTAGGVVEELYAASDVDFVYDATIGGTGGYRYNLRSNGFPSGTYRLHYTATGDPTDHYVEFRIK